MDWKPVILRKKLKEPLITKPKEKLDENGEVVVDIKKVSIKMAQIIIQGRANKNIKQIELARMCNLDTKTINDIEKADCVYNCKQINKIAKALGIKIPRE